MTTTTIEIETQDNGLYLIRFEGNKVIRDVRSTYGDCARYLSTGEQYMENVTQTPMDWSDYEMQEYIKKNFDKSEIESE